MKKFTAFIMFVVCSFIFSDASAQGTSCPALGPKALIGIATGAATGAGLGAIFSRNKGEGAAIGGLIGAIGGGIIGSSIDQTDCQNAQAALQRVASARTGQQVTWNNPANGDHGTLTPTTNPVQTSNGTCRNYQRDNVINGQQTGGDVGVVCRTASGDYQVVQ